MRLNPVCLAPLRAFRSLLFLAAGVMAGCSGQMSDQPSFRSQSLQLPPATGSLPLVELQPWAIPASESIASRSSPLRLTQAVESRGAALFRDNCSFCHGLGGKGNGPVGEVFVPHPANLTSARIRAYPDGLIYLRFTNGYSTMPAFYRRLDGDERWLVVAHVRELQRRSPSP